jgi:hypothetical protein
MDQFNSIMQTPFFHYHLPPLLLPLPGVSDALALPPLAIYLSTEPVVASSSGATVSPTMELLRWAGMKKIHSLHMNNLAIFHVYQNFATYFVAFLCQIFEPACSFTFASFTSSPLDFRPARG